MAKYQIENIRAGLILGAFEAPDEEQALDAWARSVGYPSHAELCEVSAAADGDVIVTLVD